MEHLNILGLVLFVIAGTWSVSFVLRERARFGGDLLESMWRHLVAYVAYTFYAVALGYLAANVPEAKMGLGSTSLRALNGAIYGGIVIAMTWWFSKMTFRISGRNPPRAIALALPSSSVLLALAVLARWAFDPPGASSSVTWLFLHYFPMALDAFSLACLLRLTLWNWRRPAGEEKRSAWAFILLESTYFLFYVDTAFSSLPFLRPLPHTASLLFARGTELFYALVPWLWLSLFHAPLQRKLWSGLGGRVDVEAFRCAYELTKREVEVLGLLVQGRSYKQIGEALCISVNTVKNHAYSLFRKLGVGSRHELIGKMGDFLREGGCSAPGELAIKASVSGSR
jgi:DNA-binding CsgD family transcriptional regulator/uncharacterized membrane protein